MGKSTVINPNDRFLILRVKNLKDKVSKATLFGSCLDDNSINQDCEILLEQSGFMLMKNNHNYLRKYLLSRMIEVKGIKINFLDSRDYEFQTFYLTPYGSKCSKIYRVTKQETKKQPFYIDESFNLWIDDNTWIEIELEPYDSLDIIFCIKEEISPKLILSDLPRGIFKKIFGKFYIFKANK